MKEIIHIDSREDARQFSNCSTMTVKQLDIFGSQPPQFKGATFSAERDGERLLGQLDRVRSLMKDGRWRTLGEIAEATGSPEASCSARLRDIRREGTMVNRAYVRRGLFIYQVGAFTPPASLPPAGK